MAKRSGAQLLRAPEHGSLTFGSLIFASLILGLFSTTLSAQSDAPPLQRHFIRGDFNQDGALSLPDVIDMLTFLFQGGDEPGCEDAADANDDELLTLADVITSLQVQFSGVASFPPPFFFCGPDPTKESVLSCNEFNGCDDITTAGDVAHFMRRAGYGSKPDSIDSVLASGLDNYITDQLNPELDLEMDNTELWSRINQLNVTTDINHLGRSHIIYGIYSRNQLREVMCEFWEQHFNTNWGTVRNFFRSRRVGGVAVYTNGESNALATNEEYLENQRFRDLALMPFLDLLEASATSPTMLIYLDAISNTAGDPNENYSRELLELHTMGVDNGYTQNDIEQVARCFTGWTVRKHAPGFENDPLAPALADDDATGIWSFHFDAANHDYASKTIFSGTPYQLVIPARTVGSTDGLLDGFEVLEHLAGLSQTAQYLCTKMVQKLVSDDPPPSVVQPAITEWFNQTGVTPGVGKIRDIVDLILDSTEFWDRENRWNKFETPFEYVISTARSVDAATLANPLLFGVGNSVAGLSRLDYRPFLFSTPDGQPEAGSEWLGTEEVLGRIVLGFNLASSTGDPSTNPLGLMAGAGVDTADSEAIVDYWISVLFPAGCDEGMRTLALDFLNSDQDGVPTPLDDSQVSEFDQRVRSLVGYLLGSPLGQKQ